MSKKTKQDSVYCDSLFRYTRRHTTEVRIGGTALGGMQPIRLQTMVTTRTSDIDGTVAQCLQVAAAGAEFVRITAPSVQDAESLGKIRERLNAAGCNIPLIADIHFNPAAAETAARLIEKIRINPGNFSDKPASMVDAGETTIDYDASLAKLRTKFLALLEICRTHNTALRIGANHGSLSGRIVERYGDTPAGMVESAMEFLRICKAEKFDNVVVSMKASNTRVMVQAYRLLAATMRAEEMSYPLHLGVTEAGEGEDGRIKSAVGIGALLADGLGDTIRVSLTEEPVSEIPVAKALVDYFADRPSHAPIAAVNTTNYSPYSYVKHVSNAVGEIGGKYVPVVVADLSHLNPILPKDLEALGFSRKGDLWKGSDTTPDYIYSGASLWNCDTAGLKVIHDGDEQFLFCDTSSFTPDFINWLKVHPEEVLLVDSKNANSVADLRACFLKLASNGILNPVIIRRSYEETDFEQLQLKAACDLGPLLIDGFGDGVLLSNKASSSADAAVVKLAFGILQAARVRFTRTDFISCPGCGRTLFNLQSILAKIKGSTSQLKGLKIGVMGCIVNGPGEMADADYGYVGAGPGKVTLYKGKEPVKKNIPQEEAINELISLIRENGDWVETEAGN